MLPQSPDSSSDEQRVQWKSPKLTVLPLHQTETTLFAPGSDGMPFATDPAPNPGS